MPSTMQKFALVDLCEAARESLKTATGLHKVFVEMPNSYVLRDSFWEAERHTMKSLAESVDRGQTAYLEWIDEVVVAMDTAPDINGASFQSYHQVALDIASDLLGRIRAASTHAQNHMKFANIRARRAGKNRNAYAPRRIAAMEKAVIWARRADPVEREYVVETVRAWKFGDGAQSVGDLHDGLANHVQKEYMRALKQHELDGGVKRGRKRKRAKTQGEMDREWAEKLGVCAGTVLIYRRKLREKGIDVTLVALRRVQTERRKRQEATRRK